jgi:trigger factor
LGVFKLKTFHILTHTTLDTNLDKKDKTLASLKINLTEEDYKPKVDAKLKEYSKKANIKGFRPGKVPAALINKMYGKGILVEEINTLVSSTVSNYIRENKLPIVGEPMPARDDDQGIDWDNQKDFEFTFDLGLIPDFDFKVSKDIKITNYQIDADEKTVEETIDSVRKQFGKTTNPDVAEEGDMVYGNLKHLEGDFNTDTLIPLNKIQKKTAKKFVGLKSGDSVHFDIREAFEADDIRHITGLEKEAAEKLEGEFEFTVQNVNRSAPADLDQEFFDKVLGPGTVEDEAGFREKVKEIVNDNFKRETDLYLNDSLKKSALKQLDIELPNDFLKKWLLVSNEGKITQEQIDAEFDLYLDELKWTLIRNKIAEQNEIKVETEEVVEKTKDMLRQQFNQMGLGSQIDAMLDSYTDRYLQDEKGQNFMKMYEQVYFTKVLDYMKENVSLEDKKVSAEEFKKIVSE